jgi:protein-S-isoprenylcysteine O-methyltransferase Ste14
MIGKPLFQPQFTRMAIEGRQHKVTPGPPTRGTGVLICKRRVPTAEWLGMKLLDRFVQDGDRLFRWRSYLPLAFVPVFIAGVMATPAPFSTRPAERLWEAASVAVALLGLALRAWAVGSAPAGTSERSTVNPRASELRTSGPYSVVRHPLYVANGLMALGLSMFPAVWYLPLILLTVFLLYYERIAVREEAFLSERFGAEFESWASRVPACVPSFAGYARSTEAFSWKKVLRHEFHGLLVIAAGAFVFDAVQASWRARAWRADPLWIWFAAASAACFIVFTVLKKGTHFLES